MANIRYIALCLYLTISVQAFAQDGTYKGESEGRNGKIKVEVTVASGKITDINVTESKEDKTFVYERMTKTILKHNNINIDSISGASYTSKGFLKAIEKALSSTTLNLKGSKIKAEK